ncbi:hypothetical protein PVK06_046741 [Gossypium arboreum]|uniref:Uncharacterized protein n=1 Tax=Gossypium arboreum TaxID=29729 RepID=A0ABR0MBI5_GOSAR|nr:hypothetical protein PVK06_046741 [Gossypium arboreum]
MELVSNTFQTKIAQRILQIFLVEANHEDFQVWKEELSGEYSVRSAFKLLQYASLDPNSYLIQTKIKD